MIDMNKINTFHRVASACWHVELVLAEHELPWVDIEDNHAQNFCLWHEEDIARRKDLSDSRIVEAKRNIDGYNQARNNAMERIDDWILRELAHADTGLSEGAQHSETPGMMIDRLSIMALKEYHMAEQIVRTDVDEDHRERCASRVAILREQQNDLSTALSDLFGELIRGKKRFKVYRQFKMYNDVKLNPQLYRTVST